jgi:hypothetical protein
MAKTGVGERSGEVEEGIGDNKARGEGTGDGGTGVAGRGEEGIVGEKGVRDKGIRVLVGEAVDTARQEAANMQERNRMNRVLEI